MSKCLSTGWTSPQLRRLSKWGALCHKIERYVLQGLDRPTLGGGTQLQLQHKPIQDPSKPWIWKRGSLAFWGQIEVRLQQMLQHPWAEPTLQHLQRLAWHIEEHWHGDCPITVDSFHMLFQMLWGPHDEEHLHVLLKHTAQQRELHQTQAIDAETQTYREWLTKATQKGCRGLYRTLKKDELAYLRPFQDQPRQERMESRKQQWGAIWSIRQEPLHLPQLQELIRQGAEFGQRMPPLHPKQIWHTIKHLSLKAPGLDGIGFDFLKALPYQAMQDIAQVFHQLEAQAVIPQQWTTSLIALLPKSADIERPIALVATLYRPGTECLQVALRRAFLTEHHNSMKRTVVSVLLDMSNFYDRIKLEALCNRWLDSNYPPTHAAFAMQLYLGGRILEAEGEASQQLWTENGILAGDPQAPLAAKVYLYNAMKSFHKKYPQLHTDLWIDDLSFDVVDRDPANAVRIAIQAYERIKQLLEEDNLKISEKKTGFIASNSTAKRLLQQQLPANGPKVHDVMRDLGVDCTAGRLRRIQTMRNRGGKAARKTKKLATLKIPQRSIRLKLYKGSIVAGIAWGHEAMGLAPQVRRKLKTTMGRQLGLQRTGNIDFLYDMQDRRQDSRLWFLHGSSPHLPEILWQLAGSHSQVSGPARGKPSRRSSARHNILGKWQKDPVAALQCYLMERNWDCTQYGVWTKPGHNGQRDFRLDMADDWFTLREELKRAERWERIEKINKRQHMEDVQNTLDWRPWRLMNKSLNSRNSASLATWHQGALFTKVAETEGDRQLMCPHCGQKATMRHLMWLCKETNKAFPPLNAEDQFEIDHGVHLEFWTQGLLTLPKYELATGGAAVQAWGSWTLQDEMKVSNTSVFTIGIAAASKDPRLRHYVVALVQHAGLGQEPVPPWSGGHGAARESSPWREPGTMV